jgi:hypothetical protein
MLDASTTIAPPSLYGTFDSSNTILIVTDGGRFARLSQLQFPQGQKITFKPLSASLSAQLPKGFLYDYLVHSSDR